MVTKEDEYKAEVLKLTGFAFFAPLGRIFLEPIVVFQEFGTILFICYLILIVVLSVLGFTCINRGREMISIRRNK